MINSTTLVGRLTRTPELRSTQSGVPVTNFTIACNRRFGDKDQADFINCVAWRHSAEFLCNYMQKGNLIGVEGRIQSRTYEDETGKTVYVQEVVAEQVQALESKANRENNQSYQNNNFNNNNNFNQNNNYNTNTVNTQPEEPVLDISSDDLPF